MHLYFISPPCRSVTALTITRKWTPFNSTSHRHTQNNGVDGQYLVPSTLDLSSLGFFAWKFAGFCRVCSIAKTEVGQQDFLQRTQQNNFFETSKKKRQWEVCPPLFSSIFLLTTPTATSQQPHSISFCDQVPLSFFLLSMLLCDDIFTHAPSPPFHYHSLLFS
jgi:hypothetical protein